MGINLGKLKKRSIIAILCSSLADKPHCSNHQIDTHHTINKGMPVRTSSSHDSTQNEVRYKLIIDPSEDESITRLLFMFGILKRENTRTYMCSDFFGDGQLQKVNLVTTYNVTVRYIMCVMCLPDKYHCSYKTFSCCRTYSGYESN